MSLFSKRANFCFSFTKGKNQTVPNTQDIHILMHPSTMKILRYIKGSLVLLHTEGGQLLFRCWSSTLLKSKNLMLSSVSFLQDYLKGDVFCDSYNLLLNSADTLILNCDDTKSFMETDSFNRFIKSQLSRIFIRKGLKINILYLGYPCCFIIEDIYSHFSEEISHQENLSDICENLSSLNISGNESVSEISLDENFLCSTPISSKTSTSLHTPGVKYFTNTQISKPEQFYSIHVGTKIVFQKAKKIAEKLNETSFQDLGGLEKQINGLKSFVSSLLKQDSVHKVGMHGILLVGPSGTGKTSIVQAIKNEYSLPFFTLNGVDFNSNEIEYEYQLKKLYNKIIDNSPSIFFLDNIDDFCKIGDGFSIVALISTMIYDLLRTGSNVLVIAAACNITSVDASLRKPGTLEEEIYFEIPSVCDRKEILLKILDRKCHSLNNTEIMEILEQTQGFTGGDLKLLCNKAEFLSYGKNSINFEIIKETLKDVKPKSMTEFTFQVPNVKWSDIGGMHAVKNAIIEMVDWPLKYKEQFKKLKITPSRGILLYGPPGCSKTMIAKALASEGHLNFISIKGPQLFNKYVGESEKAVSNLFKKARLAAPCVLFFDEIDSLASVRGSTSGNSNVTERVVTQLLIEIDGVDVLQGVSIIAATNRPDLIDPSFLRPGRFDQMIYVPLPDSSTRKEIFEARLKKMPHESDIDILHLVEATEGYTGAEITGVCHEAAMLVIQEYISSPNSVVTMHHFLMAMQSVMPRTSKESIDFYENYNKRNLS